MTFIIAEIGVNHNGCIETAKTLIDKAKLAGANAAKFQAFTPERLDPPGDRREMLKRLALSADNLRELSRYCESVGIEFMATPFDVDWLSFLLEQCGIRRIKIASGSVGDEELLRAAAATGLPVVLSTGMLETIGEIDAAIDLLHPAKVTLLHCVSAYPTPVDAARLSCIRVFATHFKDHDIGISCHSTSIYPAIAAVAMGATVIEKHLTLDTDRSGPDHAASIEPDEFNEMVLAIRTIERAIQIPQGDYEAAARQVKKEREEWRQRLSSGTADTAG